MREREREFKLATRYLHRHGVHSEAKSLIGRVEIKQSSLPARRAI